MLASGFHKFLLETLVLAYFKRISSDPAVLWIIGILADALRCPVLFSDG